MYMLYFKKVASVVLAVCTYVVLEQIKPIIYKINKKKHVMQHKRSNSKVDYAIFYAQCTRNQRTKK